MYGAVGFTDRRHSVAAGCAGGEEERMRLLATLRQNAPPESLPGKALPPTFATAASTAGGGAGQAHGEAAGVIRGRR